MKRIIVLLVVVVLIIPGFAFEDNREYDWYYTQKHTGIYSSINCTVACLCMVEKWNDESFDLTVEEVRELIGTRKPLRFSKMREYLTDKDIEQAELPTAQGDAEGIQDALSTGIVIVCVDIGFTYDQEPQFKKFHAVVVAETYEQDGTQYFTIYDPASGIKECTLEDFEKYVADNNNIVVTD